MAEVDSLAAQPTRSGCKVMRTIQDTEPDWTQLAGAALTGAFLGPVITANKK